MMGAHQVFLFFNGYTTQGIRFRALAEKYALFNNLALSDPILEILKLYPPDSSYAYKETAFSSVEARLALGLSADSVESLMDALQGIETEEPIGAIPVPPKEDMMERFDREWQPPTKDIQVKVP